MRRYCSVIKFAILTLWLQSSATLAAINIQIAETGGDVVVSASGSFDTSQCSSSALGTASPLLFSGSGSTDVLIGVGGNNLLCVVNFSANPAGLFGGDTSQLASTSLGDFVGFGVLPDEVFLPDAYVSGSPLSGSSTYTGQTLASLNLNVGAYTFVAGTESVTVIVNAAAAPVSVSALPNWALALLGLMIAGLPVVFLGQRKKA